MTDRPERDPEIQRAVDTAARELVRRLEPWHTGMRDPAGFAMAFIEAMYEDGWRPIPRPEPIVTRAPRNPETAHRGAELVREALTNTRKNRGDNNRA